MGRQVKHFPESPVPELIYSLLGFLALALSVVPVILLVRFLLSEKADWLTSRSRANTCVRSLRSWQVHLSSQAAMTPLPPDRGVAVKRLSSWIRNSTVRSHYKHQTPCNVCL